MTALDLDRLEQLARGATPGPWSHDLDQFSDEDGPEACITDGTIAMLARIGTDVALPPRLPDHIPFTAERRASLDAAWALAKESQAMRDAAFIAAASPDVVIALVQRVRKAEANQLPSNDRGTCTCPGNGFGWRTCPVHGNY